LYAGESDDATTDPELEEAAIRFANGDDTGAETGLLGALRGGSVSRESAGIWTAALFDLYRATGQQMKFEGVAVEFAERFGRSAPAWFSMPEMLGHGAPAVQISISPGLEPDAVLWKSPARLNTESVGELRLAIANVTSPWHLDWTPIVSIHVDAVPPLGRLFATWCTQDVLLRFSGAQALEQVLRPLTVSGDSSCDPLWWRLRMDALRIMRRQDEFELVALDFCVTYEVSPPSWQLPRCEYAQEGVGEGNGLASPLMQQSGFAGLDPDPRNALTAPMSLEPSGAVLVELVGEILGDAAAALEKLETSRRGSKRLVVSCSKLIRVDFAAAGTILNWVAAREGEGCQVQFRDMHRLVAAFFNVIGIHEHASVIRRMT
jgi:anti-anti-sigma regulatory factor